MAEIRDVSYETNGVQILDHVTTRFRPYRFNVILGPNGAGKTTLLKIGTGLLPPSSGSVTYDDRPLRDFQPDELARKRAVLSQQMDLTFSLPVRDVVLMGRYPHYGHSPSRRDLDIVSQSIDMVGLTGKTDQPYPTLSGGERQKAHLARVLAQIWSFDSGADDTYLFLDEPTNGLDIHYEIHLLDVARQLLQHRCTVIAIMHDVNLALQHGNAFFFLNAGRLVEETDSRDEVSRELLERVFQVKAHRISDPSDDGSVWRFGL